MPPTDLRSSRTSALRLSLTRLNRRLRRHARAGLTPSQLSALSTLEHHGVMSLGRLAEHEQISKSSTTRLAARLEDLGLVVRSQDADDGRVFAVDLTPRGRELLAEASRRADAYLDRQIAALDAADRRQIEAIIPVLQRLLGVKA